MKPSDLRRGTILGANGAPVAKTNTQVKVVVGIPSMGTWSAHTGVAVASLTSTAAMMGMGIYIIAEMNSVITQARNKIVRGAKQLEADFILWVDADMKFPANSLSRLMAHGKDWTCAFYNQRIPPHRTIGRIKGPAFDARKGGLHEADIAGMGLMLTHMRLFNMPAPWFFESYDEKAKTPANPDGHIGEDTNFIRKGIAAGFKLYVDLDLTFEVGHVGDNVITCLRPPPDQQSPNSPSHEPQLATTI